MYETYVPATTVERRPPTIAEIVRQKTDDGARIIDFFLDLMEGRVDGAMLCHRIDAAKQLVKYGSKKAADFIAEHGDEPCDHCESRKRGPRPRKDESPAAKPQHAPGPFGYDFLTLLTEDFLTVVSAVDEDLMIKLVRAQTRDGATVIDFLDDVMEGRNKGFRPNHRIAAGKELISHILRDEHVIARTVLEVVADPRVRPLPASHTPSPVEPAPYSIRGAGFKPALPGAAWEPCNSPTVVRADAGRNPGNTPVVPAQAGTQRGGEGRSEPTEEPKIVRPELVEEPALSLPKGQRSGESAVPGPAAKEADLTVVTAEAGFLPQEPSPTQRGGERRSGSQLGSRSRKPTTLPTIPGRSPP